MKEEHDFSKGGQGKFYIPMENTFTAIILKVENGYIGYVAELPGANTQGLTIKEVRENLKEATKMVLEANREFAEAEIEGDFIKEPINVSI